jgi:hypothetical protein
MGCLAIKLGWTGSRLAPHFCDSGAKAIGIKAHIGEQVLERKAADQVFGLEDVVHLTRGQNEADGITERIHPHIDPPRGAHYKRLNVKQDLVSVEPAHGDNLATQANAAMDRPQLRTRGQRLRAARKRRFPSARAAAISFGIPVSTYGAHERAQARGGRDFGPHEARQYAQRLGVTAEWLLTGYQPAVRAKSRSTTIAHIHGNIGIDGEVRLFNILPENLETELPPLVTEATVGLAIRGDSLGRAFANWVLIYDDLREPAAPEVIGELCVIGLADGRVVIKRLVEGAVAEIAVVWAARVKALVPVSGRIA